MGTFIHDADFCVDGIDYAFTVYNEGGSNYEASFAPIGSDDWVRLTTGREIAFSDGMEIPSDLWHSLDSLIPNDPLVIDILQKACEWHCAVSYQ